MVSSLGHYNNGVRSKVIGGLHEGPAKVSTSVKRYFIGRLALKLSSTIGAWRILLNQH